MPSSNKKSQSGPLKRYTTRQIMELTEKRRKQMAQEAQLEQLALQKAAEFKAFQDSKVDHEVAPGPVEEKISLTLQDTNASQTQKNTDDQKSFQTLEGQKSLLEAPVKPVRQLKVPAAASVTQDDDLRSFHEAIAKFTRQVIEHPARAEFPPEAKAEIKIEEPSLPVSEKQDAQPPKEPTAVDGKSVAAMFREQPQTPSEKAVSDLIEREFDKAAQNVVLIGKTSPDAAAQEKPPARGIKSDRVNKGSQGVPKDFLPVAMEWAFTLASSVLLVFMFVHVAFSGWNSHYYDQSQFVLMMALSALWFNRRQLQRRTQWFWGSTVIIAGGLGVLLSAAHEGLIFIELAGFVIVSFGLFLWRYTEESASRLFFPFACLMFMLAPPGHLEEAVLPELNNLIYGLSAGILNSFHLPALFDEGNFHVGVGTVSALGDPVVFRSIVAFLSLAVLGVSFLNMTGSWSLFLCVSVIFWSVLAGVVRVTITGVMLENFGVEYASNFFTEYSVVVVMIVLAAAIMLTAGLLPHKEE